MMPTPESFDVLERKRFYYRHFDCFPYPTEHTITPFAVRFGSNYSSNLFFGKHERKSFFMLSANYIFEIINIFMPYMAEIKKQSRRSLILCRRADVFFHCKICQKFIDLLLSDIFKIIVIRSKKIPQPSAIVFYRADTVVFCLKGFDEFSDIGFVSIIVASVRCIDFIDGILLKFNIERMCVMQIFRKNIF